MPLRAARGRWGAAVPVPDTAGVAGSGATVGVDGGWGRGRHYNGRIPFICRPLRHQNFFGLKLFTGVLVPVLRSVTMHRLRVISG